ncbi:dihydrolipoyl dehydrogenase family protein [Candidatus Electrothrix sp.]|uniref:dihydrolipoyl dehydrogenase family protein n=1 Tax=Candidatus Electrothrix sp. TaxID=2170559 RepID=UPI004057A5CD
MASYEYDIGIIGGGAAGLTIASGAAQLGAKTLLIEKEQELGGDCLHFGCVPSKTLIKSAQVYHQLRTTEAFGLPAVEVPPVDFALVAERIRSVIAVIQQHDSVERFNKLGAQILFGDPRFTDEHSVELGNKSITAKNWVIATGSEAAIPPIPGLEQTPFLTNREIFSLNKLPESMIILGCGPIGCEMGQAFQRLGTRVTMINRSNQILSKEDLDMAQGVMEMMTSEGVQFYLNSTIQSVKEQGEHKEVVLKEQNSSNGSTTTLEAETILVALGRSPNIDGLGLDQIGVKTSSKGVTVDRRLRTSQPHIYAAGDVTGGPQFTHAAGYQGGIVISNAIFHLPRRTDYTWLPWCTFTEPSLGSIGMNERMAQAAGIEYTVQHENFVDNDRCLAEGQGYGKLKLLLNRKEKPIGVQILGPHAGDLLGEWIAALNGKVKLTTLASAIHPYPTVAEINKRVAGSLLSPKLFSDRTRKILKLLFRYQGSAV